MFRLSEIKVETTSCLILLACLGLLASTIPFRTVHAVFVLEGSGVQGT